MKIALCLSGDANLDIESIMNQWINLFTELSKHEVVVFLVHGGDGNYKSKIMRFIDVAVSVIVEDYDSHVAASKLSFLVQKYEKNNDMNFDVGIKCELKDIYFDKGWLILTDRTDEVYSAKLNEPSETIINHYHFKEMSFDFFYAYAFNFIHLMHMHDFNYKYAMAIHGRKMKGKYTPSKEHYFYFHVKRLGYHAKINDRVVI